MFVPLRNIAITLSLTLVTLATAGYLWNEVGYEMLIVAMGWPHVILGFAFYLGRVLRGESNSRFSFLLLSLVTIVLWIVHYYYAITGLIYLFFLYHAFRDEVFVYLQTRARHRSSRNLFSIAGLGPLILLMLLIPQQQAFRQDLRRAEFSSAIFPANSGWQMISFKAVPNSRGRDFYFYLQAPQTDGLRGFASRATVADSRQAGEILVNDLSWPSASDLVFQPNFGSDGGSPMNPEKNGTIPVLLTGGHRVGQTFTAQANDLSGIWFWIDPLEDRSKSREFIFHLASPPLLPYPPGLATLRMVLIAVLGVLVIWQLVARVGHNSQLWMYMLVLAGAFAITQTVLKSGGNDGQPFPLVFQFVVVYHYWSWYVYSYDKLKAMGKSAAGFSTPNVGWYQSALGYLRNVKYFSAVVILLNVLSAVSVFWYYSGDGPSALRYFFDYSYFLYFLVLHVTFSFDPGKLDIRRLRRFRRINGGLSQS